MATHYERQAFAIEEIPPPGLIELSIESGVVNYALRTRVLKLQFF